MRSTTAIRRPGPRWAATGLFYVNGAVVGTWIAKIPSTQERFALSEGTMGVLLIGMALAVVVTMPLAGEAIGRCGAVPALRISTPACVAAVNLPLLAPSPELVMAGLFVLGAATATMDVAMNSHGVEVEARLGRPIMSSLHAGWSFGGMTGAGTAAALAALGAGDVLAVAIASALLLAILLAVLREVDAGTPAATPAGQGFRLPGRGVLPIALLCLLIMVTEGAMGDWAGIYLERDLGASAALASLGYAAFTAGMTAGRLVGDAANSRLGAVRLLRLGALLTGVPLALMLLLAAPGAALAGLFAIGLGVANGVPLLFSAAGRRVSGPPAPAIAAVSSLASLGFLAGPPALGFLAEATSLPLALSTLVLGSGVVLASAGRAIDGRGPRAVADGRLLGTTAQRSPA